MKEYKKMLIAAVAVCLLPMVLSAIVYQDLPDRIAVHWNSAGVADGFAPKAVAAFGLPIFMALIEVICVVGTLSDPKKRNQSPVLRMLVFWLVPVLTLVVQPVTLFIALGKEINVTFVVTILIGVVFLLVGNYLPKSRQNYTIGIKLPWTLDDADNWNKTHRLAGVLFILAGLLMIGPNFVPMPPAGRTILTVAVILLTVAVPMVYSFLLYVTKKK